MTDERGHVRGMGIMVIAMMFLPLIDAIAKWLTETSSLSPASIAFARFAFQTLIAGALLPVFVASWRPRWQRLWPNLVRGVLVGVASMLFFIAVKYMPLADAMAVFFVEPMILTMLSALILKEPVGWRRWSAVAVGFLGALIVIQPSYELFGAVSLLPLVTATLFAIYMVLNRRMTGQDPILAMQCMAGIGGLAATGLVLVLGHSAGIENLEPGWPDGVSSWLLLACLGLVATFGHLMVVEAFRHAQASLLAPFQYIEIVTATIVGLAVFGDFPTASKWLGILIIIGSGLYTFWREGRRRDDPRPVPKE